MQGILGATPSSLANQDGCGRQRRQKTQLTAMTYFLNLATITRRQIKSSCKDLKVYELHCDSQVTVSKSCQLSAYRLYTIIQANRHSKQMFNTTFQRNKLRWFMMRIIRQLDRERSVTDTYFLLASFFGVHQTTLLSYFSGYLTQI